MSAADDPDARAVSSGWSALATRLVQAGRPETLDEAGSLVNAPVSRGSTILFPSIDAMQSTGRRKYDHVPIYGAMGSDSQHRLEDAIAAVEGGTHAQVVSSGLAACTTALLTFLSAGDHCLIPDSVYGPTRRFASTMLRRLGIETSYYPPLATGEEIRLLLRPNTTVVFAESPGSHTFEVQDVPMLANLAHEHRALLLLDNTWGIGAFQPFAHGVDVSIQALTKYPAGHSDAIIGAITVAQEPLWHRLRDSAIQLGQLAGPDECWLTLRGLRTMGVRLERQSRSALTVARWLTTRPEVARVLHPALPDCPGHAIWQRDFTAASALFGVVLRPDYGARAMGDMIDALAMFGLGASWGGYESLVLPTTDGIVRSTAGSGLEGPAFRLHIGLEDPADLIDDLKGGFAVLQESSLG
ncbi:cystathionine beta-lyase [Ameyamaea chiangmaiensis NBRC 103196]|uniref:Cystathionine beta-lyase n=1 Tax=Ameyamaea chiangmaiensis TaxID=442969 RepID=A0A850P5G2_9PROT|nr:cystathionine beta-lyase [Ameyamaea chiangmaiensis]MBS4073678.1 cystathionine beta-lyase [Ameyamaea chiangmaiensis]NVN39054.1 cystathionine beta-lyase [Ameyamaea chiangmaiensis]GBQ68838.1 cystathionine beta-lyase [Ameyamaea chiangmaiensis NBRC 103196]